MINEEYSPGDLVTKTASYSANYPGWKITSGVVLAVKKRMVKDDSLGATDRAVYRGRYGKAENYPCYEMVISTSEGNYLVSQFGFNKDQ